MNGQLALHIGNGLEAAVYSFGSGLIILTILLLAQRPMREGLGRVRGALRSGDLRWWQVIGGFLGAYFVAVQSFTVPVLGVAIFMVAIVAGQSGNSLLVDRAGLGPAGKQPITAQRAVSAAIAVIAVAVAVSDRVSSGSISVLAVVFALSAGVVIAVQSAINGRVARVAQHPMSATFLNFAMGSVGLVAAFATMWVLSDLDPSALWGAPWWAYLGGAVGIVFIAIAVWVVPIVGVLVYALTSIAGQLFGALLLDFVAPTPGTEIVWNLFAGVFLAFVAVLVAARGRSRA